MTRPAVALAALALFLLANATLPAQAPDRSVPPTLGPAPAVKMPPIQKRALSNGLPVWIIESHKVPLVQVNLLVLAGSGDDPAGRFGLANLTAAMLDEGAGTRSSLDIADAVEFLGADLSATSSFDASAVRLNVPVARLEAALPIFADVALRPTFPQKDLDRVRDERLTAILQARDDPEQIAPLAFQRIVFGTTHRYGAPAFGSEATVKAFTPDDLRGFHQAWFQPANARLVVVGDVTADAVLPLLERQFGGWRNATPTRRTPVPTAPALTASHIYIVDKPDAPQSMIRIGNVGVARSTPDFFTLEVLNTLLGGSFASRLNQNLREEHQYTYGAASRFDMRLSPGSFVAAAGVQTDKTSEALQEFVKELTAISGPATAEELSRARNYLALGFPADFETSGDLSRRIEELLIYGLPDSYVEQYVGNIQRVTPAAVRAAATKYIRPSTFAVVVVGDRRQIEAGIRALKIAPVTVLTVSEALGS